MVGQQQLNGYNMVVGILQLVHDCAIEQVTTVSMVPHALK